MADTRLVLGGVTFRGFEVPERIVLPGGAHTIHTHSLIGGARVLDMMGPDPVDISWHGRFRGNDALSRFHAVDNIRISGREVSLTYHGQFWWWWPTSWRPAQALRDPIRDQLRISQVNGGVVPGLGSLIGADVGSLAGLIGGLL